MDCDQIIEQVDALIDSELPPSVEAALRTHAAGCVQCAREIQAASDLRERLAALPDRQLPTRDLWPEIAARITPGSSEVRPRRWPRLTAIAATAAGVAIATLIGLQVGDKNAPEEPGVAVQGGSVVVTVDPGLRLAAQSMLDAAEADGGGLSPETIAVVRENLALIDHALQEIADALEVDADNPQLQRQFLQVYRGQAELLEYIGRVGTRQATRTDL